MENGNLCASVIAVSPSLFWWVGRLINLIQRSQQALDELFSIFIVATLYEEFISSHAFMLVSILCF